MNHKQQEQYHLHIHSRPNQIYFFFIYFVVMNSIWEEFLAVIVVGREKKLN